MANSNTATTGTNGALASRLRAMVYQVDHTGTLPANKVVETRTLTDANRSDFNHIVPSCAPFFANSMRIRKVSTNEELVEGIHFYCVGTFVKATLNVADYHQICWAIIFDDPRISGEYELTYQTIGGEFVLNQQELAEALANHMENPRMIDWENVVGRPLTFPPAPHTVHTNDLRGGKAIVKELDDIEQAIRALLADEEADHPGYGQVLAELFRQNHRLDDLNDLLEKQRQANNRSMAGMKDELVKEDTRIEKKLDDHIADVTNIINNTVNPKIEQLRTTVEANDAALRIIINNNHRTMQESVAAAKTEASNALAAVQRTLTSSIDNTRTTLTQSLNTTAAAIRSEFAASDTVINNRITSVNSALTKSISDNLEAAKAYTNSERDKLNTALRSHVSTTVDAAKAALQGSINTAKQEATNAVNNLRSYLDGNFVKLTTDQEVNGTKSFQHWIRIRKQGDDTKYAEISRSGSNLMRFYSDRDVLNITDGWMWVFNGLAVRRPTETSHGFNLHAVNDSNGRYTSLEGATDVNNGRLSVHDLYVRSDIRVKENIRQIEEPLEKIRKLHGYTYNLVGSKTRAGGVIAQEVQEVLPEVVYELGTENKQLSVSYQAITGLLLEGMRELINIVDQLREEKGVK